MLLGAEPARMQFREQPDKDTVRIMDRRLHLALPPFRGQGLYGYLRVRDLA
jgi:hypothetical protein